MKNLKVLFVLVFFPLFLIAGNEKNFKLEEVYNKKTKLFQSAVNLVIDICKQSCTSEDTVLCIEIDKLCYCLETEKEKLKEMFISNLTVLYQQKEDINRQIDFDTLYENTLQKAEQLYKLACALAGTSRKETQLIIIRTFQAEYNYLR